MLIIIYVLGLYIQSIKLYIFIKNTLTLTGIEIFCLFSQIEMTSSMVLTHLVRKVSIGLIVDEGGRVGSHKDWMDMIPNKSISYVWINCHSLTWNIYAFFFSKEHKCIVFINLSIQDKNLDGNTTQ